MSSPKEKAKELVNKYLNKAIHFPYIDTQDGRCIATGYMTFVSAKQCALIAVDEILALNLQYSDIEYGGINSYEFWEQVKTEIENI